jgi:hypothetical protein
MILSTLVGVWLFHILNNSKKILAQKKKKKKKKRKKQQQQQQLSPLTGLEGL